MIKIIKNNQKGITLIALVITIIVLLILAGVAISMLSGDNGILKQAADAKIETELKSEEEELKLAAMAALTAGKGKMKGEQAFETLNKELRKIKGYVDEGDITSLPKTVKIGKNEYTIKLDGTIGVATDLDKLPTIKAGDYASEKSKYIDSNNKIALIPEGFTVSNVKTAEVDETTIKSGLVIYKGDISSTGDMTTCKTTNDQFVWIPVDDPSTMYGTKDNGEYYGKLYDFNSDGTTTHLNWYEEIEVTDEKLQQAQEEYDTALNEMITYYTQAWDDDSEVIKQMFQDNFGITVTTKDELIQAMNTLYETQMGPRPETKEEFKEKEYETSFREPAYLSNLTNGDAGSYNTVGITESSLQTEYKEMIESVEKYGGFYVGRYETSLDETTKNAQVKSGEQAATAGEDSANTWYGLYQKQKEYSEKNSLTNIVGSTMIWGSQYDQMMIWMQKNGINVRGNIGNNKNPGIGNEVGTTGTTPTDVINNIYDIYGNGYEWTLEARKTYHRIGRGGHCNNIDSPSNRGQSDYPYIALVNECSRVALYIK